MSKEEYALVCLVGHGSIHGKLKHVRKFGMDFVEVFSPVYEIVSETSRTKHDVVEVFERLVAFKSSGMYTYHSIFSIDILPGGPEKTRIHEDYGNLPF